MARVGRCTERVAPPSHLSQLVFDRLCSLAQRGALRAGKLPGAPSTVLCVRL